MGKLDFHMKYRSLTANPFSFDSTFIQVLPSFELQPYIHCFWGSLVQFNPMTAPLYYNRLIIPDTCFDLIFIQNNASGLVKIIFRGLDNHAYTDVWDEKQAGLSVFGVRFHFWAIGSISKCPMEGTQNQGLPPEAFFPEVEDLCSRIFQQPDFNNRIKIAEQYLKKYIDIQSISSSILNATQLIISRKGVGTLAELSNHMIYSKRQTQRLFLNVVGMSPKQFMNLIRYQSVWQEMCCSVNVNFMDLVFRYGYTDQSHLISDFKKYHSLTPMAALKKLRMKHSTSLISYTPNHNTIIIKEKDWEEIL